MRLAIGNNSKFYKDGKISQVQGEDLMSTATPYASGYISFAFLAFPNRNSTPFKENYNTSEAETIIQGILRYAGFPGLVKTIVDIGFLSQDHEDYLKASSKPITWTEATAKILKSSSSSENNLIWAISSKITLKDTAEKTKIINALRWIGFFPQESTTPLDTPLKTLCATLEKYAYAEGERDLVFLQHTFGVEHKDGRKKTRTSMLCDYGDPKGYSAMAKTVGTTCGVSVMMSPEGRLGKGLNETLFWRDLHAAAKRVA